MSAADQTTSIAETLAEVRGVVAALAERVTELELALAGQSSLAVARNGSSQALSASKAVDEVTPEIVAAICAALAAHLGVRPHIRQISLVGGRAWAQQGRVTIQASHALAIQRD
jgi:methylmalonyl-CoA carboxyltransferase 12S subunit